MLHLPQESFVQYGSSNFGGYETVNQKILCLSLLCTFLYNQYEMWNVMNSLLQFSPYSLDLNSKFLLEIMTLVINITVGWNVTPSDLINR